MFELFLGIENYNIEAESNSLFLTWVPPDTCNLYEFNYSIYLNSEHIIDILERNYTFENLEPCLQYNISITPNIIDDKWNGFPEIIQENTKPSDNGKINKN